MFGIKKLDPKAGSTTGEHLESDANLMNILDPSQPLAGTTGNVLRSGLYALGGFMGAKKYYTGTFSFGG